MSRSVTGSKGPGFEYWGARPGNKYGGHHGTRAHKGSNWQKKATRKAERQMNKVRLSEKWDD
jgi:hypothetical protein